MWVNIDTSKVMIIATLKVGNIDGAFGVLHKLNEDEHQPSPSLYAPIFKAHCKRGQFDDAFSFLY